MLVLWFVGFIAFIISSKVIIFCLFVGRWVMRCE